MNVLILNFSIILMVDLSNLHGLVDIILTKVKVIYFPMSFCSLLI